jgi:hypothetical protein
MDKNSLTYNPEANVSNKKDCHYGAASLYHNKPLINPFVAPIVTVQGTQVTVSWLTTKFMLGSVNVSNNPQELFLTSEQNLKLGQVLGSVSSFSESTPGTWHTITFKLKAGTYYLRALSSIGNYVVYSQEYKVVLK